MTKQKLAYERTKQIRNIRTGEPVGCVEMTGFLKSSGYGMLDDFWDEDGDSVGAAFQLRFKGDGEPAVHVVFKVGSDPRVVARMLGKMVGMLRGEAASEIVNLGVLVDQTDYARRLEDGVYVGNGRQEFLNMQTLRDEEQS